MRLGKRVIATRVFDVIWKTDDGLSQLTRHNNYNDFVGEVLIPELPRGVLTTVNNKSQCGNRCSIHPRVSSSSRNGPFRNM